MDVTASSSYTLTNVSYSDDGSNVRCSAAGSSLLVNSSDVSLTGKSIWISYMYSCSIKCQMLHDMGTCT